MTEAELELQQKRHAFIQIQRTGLELAEEKGIAKGIELGMQQGMQEGILQVARNMLANGLEPALVAQLTGLTPQQLADKTPTQPSA